MCPGTTDNVDSPVVGVNGLRDIKRCCPELARPYELSVAIISSNIGIEAAGARLPRLCPVRMSDRVDAEVIDGDRVKMLEGCGAGLAGPNDRTIGVVFPDVVIGPAGPGLARQLPDHRAGYVDTIIVIHRHVMDVVEAGSAKLAGPQFVAVEIVFAQERVKVAGVGLSREGPICESTYIDALADCDSPAGKSDKVIPGGSELAGPDNIAVRIVLADEHIDTACTRLAGQGPVCVTDDIDIAGTVGRDPTNCFIPCGPKLMGPFHCLSAYTSTGCYNHKEREDK